MILKLKLFTFCFSNSAQTPPPRIRKLRDRSYYYTMDKQRKSNDAQQEMLLTGQCPNCSHSTTILYSAPPALQDTVEYVQDEREIMYTTTPKKQRPALSSVNVSMIGVMGWMRCFAFIFNLTAPLFPKFSALENLIFLH